MTSLDYYTLLGVTPYASAREIDQAYRTLIDRLGSGPDGSPALIGLLGEAHQTLADPRRRADYDRGRTAAVVRPMPVQQPPPQPQPMAPPMQVPVHDAILLQHLKKWRRRRRIAAVTILLILLLWWLAANMNTWFPPQ
jgi:curved DNA-binding protein CbpA